MKLASVAGGILVCLAIVGCGSNNQRIKLYPVKGKVLVKGQPAEGASGGFFPVVSEVDGEKMLTPVAETDSSGEYRLESYEPHDGAPDKDYKVTISWLEPLPASAQGIFNQRDRLAGRYSNPNTPKLTAHVEREGGEISPFEL